MISISSFHVFIVNNGGKCPLGGVLAHFYRPRGVGFDSFFARGWGIRPSKIALMFCRGGGGGMVRLEID